MSSIKRSFLVVIVAIILLTTIIFPVSAVDTTYRFLVPNPVTNGAELLEMEQANYSKYERGVKQLGVKTIIKLCKIYNVSADYLLELSDELKPLF